VGEGPRPEAARGPCGVPATLSEAHNRTRGRNTHEIEGKRAISDGVIGQCGSLILLSGREREWAWGKLSAGGKCRRVQGRVGGGVRGRVEGFSSSSRLRCLRDIGKIPEGAVDRRLRKLVLFGTLTYPEEFPAARASKRHLHAFREAFRRRWPGAGFKWKLEPQERGAPHYHLLLLFEEDMAAWGSIQVGDLPQRIEFQEWLAETWYRIVGSGDERHLWFHRNGERVVEVVHTYRQLQRYIGKYVGKAFGIDQVTWSEPGRFWGTCNRAAFLKIQESVLYVMPEGAYNFIRRCMRRLAPKLVRRRDCVRRHVGTFWTWDRDGGEKMGGRSTVLERLIAEVRCRGWPVVEYHLDAWGKMIDAGDGVPV